MEQNVSTTCAAFETILNNLSNIYNVLNNVAWYMKIESAEETVLEEEDEEEEQKEYK